MVKIERGSPYLSMVFVVSVIFGFSLFGLGEFL